GASCRRGPLVRLQRGHERRKPRQGTSPASQPPEGLPTRRGLLSRDRRGRDQQPPYPVRLPLGPTGRLPLAPRLRDCGSSRPGGGGRLGHPRRRSELTGGIRMALIGLVRVSTQKQETARQHDALDPICERVFEEKISGKLGVDDRPGLKAAIDFMRNGDMLAVQEVDRLGRNLLEGLIVLNDLFERGIAVKVLEGIAAGAHTERSLILDMALALAEDRRRDIARKTRNGLEAARARGRVGGRPRVVDDDLQAVILARRDRGESIREISRATGVSVGSVHSVLTTT